MWKHSFCEKISFRVYFTYVTSTPYSTLISTNRGTHCSKARELQLLGRGEARSLLAYTLQVALLYRESVLSQEHRYGQRALQSQISSGPVLPALHAWVRCMQSQCSELRVPHGSRDLAAGEQCHYSPTAKPLDLWESHKPNGMEPQVGSGPRARG